MRDGWKCRLCGAASGHVVHEVLFASVWTALEHDFQVDFSHAVRQRHTPSSSVKLFRCHHCTLESFFPAVPGDEEFYHTLSRSPAYYEDDRWEFNVVTERLEPSQVVMDLGAGLGRFLAQARNRGCKTIAIEHNPRAQSELRADGVDVYGSISEYKRSGGRQVDVFCVLQTLEHVADVRAVVSDAIGILRPGGRLFVSVPNRDRVPSPDLEPLDHPPHHLSRWSTRTLHELAHRHGLRLVDIQYEEPDRSHAREYARLRLPGFLGRAAGRAVASQSIYRLVRRIRMLTRLGVYGHTMLAELQEPS